MSSPSRLNDIVIVGTGGLGREVRELLGDLADDGSGWHLLGWIDQNDALHGEEVHGLEVLGDETWLEGHLEVAVVVAIGSPAPRARVVKRLREVGCKRFPSLVHPSATIGRRVVVGQGSIFTSHSVCTTDSQIGEFVVVNPMAALGHDGVVGSYTSIAPSVTLCGEVEVGEGCDFGAGSTVINQKTVGEWTIVGAGATVLSNLPANCTAVGTPARVVKRRSPGWQMEVP